MNLGRATKAVLVAGALVASLFPMTEAMAAPNVELLNPSGYTGDQIPQRLISGRDDATNETYEFVAWVADAPANALVEFEIIGVENPTAQATFTGVPVGNDTWSAEAAIPETFTDGRYTLRAILYQGVDEVDTVQTTVTINNGTPPPAANTVSILSPANGAGIGFYTPPGKRPVAHVSGTASGDAAQARLLFSTSSVGSAPTWTQCGGAAVADTGQFIGRCTLPEEVNPNNVRAIAAVANNTPPPGDPVAAADESGDAHRVVPYTARPNIVRFDGANNSYTPAPGACQQVVAQVVDQNMVPIPTSNVDIHAHGPDDQLRFASRLGANSGFQSPDQGHGATEAAAQCEQTDPSGQQAEHSVPGGADIKHIESTGGTNANGQFTFFLRSSSMGGTLATMWADNDDDDSRDPGEAAGTARIGWGQSPPPPQQELILDPGSGTAQIGSCERIVVEARQDGSPIVGANLDIHITGPTGVSFCSAEGSGTRPPDMGHTGDSDGGDTRHNEGETNAQGQLVFGVTAPVEGTTEVAVWLDSTDDDVHTSPEPASAGEVSWQQIGDRSISIRSNRRRVRKGRRVVFRGEITAAEQCADDQRVTLKARRPGTRKFRAIRRGRTDDVGEYRFRVRVRRTRQYRVVAPRGGVCDPARSRIIRVRARRR